MPFFTMTVHSRQINFRILFLSCLLILSIQPAGSSAFAANGTITGLVTDSLTGEPMTGVTLRIQNTPFGSVTESNGKYRIRNVPSGQYRLQASFIGYRTVEKLVLIPEDKTVTVNFFLRPNAVTVSEIQVIATKERQSQEDTRTSLHRLEPIETKVLAGGVEDVLRSLQAIPGVVAQNDFSAQLFVRGSGPDQNLMVMDDIEVFNPYRLYGTISMFNPETLSDISLITGGFPAKYGDRLSAVLDITNRTGRRNKPFAAQINANITDANFIAEGEAPFGLDGSWLISSRRTYYDLIVGPILRKQKLVEGDVAFPNFFDFQTKLVFELGPKHQLLFTGVIGRDNVDIVTSERTSDRPDSLNVGNDTQNDAFGVAWHYTPNSDLFNKFIVSWYRNAGSSRFSGNFVDSRAYPDEVLDSLQEAGVDPSLLAFQAFDSESSFEFTKLSFRDEMSYTTGRHLIEAGAGTDVLTTTIFFFINATEATKIAFENAQQTGRIGAIPLDTTISQSETYFRSNVYVQDRYELIEKKLFIQPGLRFDYYALIAKAYLSPRFNVSYALGPLTTFRAAWGLYYQSPGYEKLIDQDKFFDLSAGEEFIRSLKAEKAVHYVLGIDRWLDERWQLKLEAYYKRFSNVLVQRKEVTTAYEVTYLGGDAYNVENWTEPFATTAERLTAIPANAGTGDAYGFEILLGKRNMSSDDRFSGWVSYALAFANRERDGQTSPFNFDQRHTINVVANYKLLDWLDVGVRWRYGSGFPYTPPAGVAPRVVPLDESETQWAIQRDDLLDGRVIFDLDYGDEKNQNSARLPDYHRLDIRFTAHTEFWGAKWAFYIDVINAYNRINVIGYSYDILPNPEGGLPVLERREQGMLPIIPTLGISAVF